MPNIDLNDFPRGNSALPKISLGKRSVLGAPPVVSNNFNNKLAEHLSVTE